MPNKEEIIEFHPQIEVIKERYQGTTDETGKVNFLEFLKSDPFADREEAAHQKVRALKCLVLTLEALDRARGEARDLEGMGYSDIYDGINDIGNRLHALSLRLKRLDPPTGVFHC